MRRGNALIVPHDAVFQGGVHDSAVVANGHIWTYGTVLDDDIVADKAGLYDCYVFIVVRALFHPVLQKPGVRLN